MCDVFWSCFRSADRAMDNASTEPRVKLLVLLFPGFEPLDADGPICFFGACSPAIEVVTIAKEQGACIALSCRHERCSLTDAAQGRSRPRRGGWAGWRRMAWKKR